MVKWGGGEWGWGDGGGRENRRETVNKHALVQARTTEIGAKGRMRSVVVE